VRLLGVGAGTLLGALSRLTGMDMINDLTSFFALLGDMTADFSARAAHVDQLLRADETTFMLVTSAQAEAIDEALWFRSTLQTRGLPFSGVVVNHFHHDLVGPHDPGALEVDLSDLLDPELCARVVANCLDYRVLARRDAAEVGRLERELSDERVLLVPEFDDSVHDVAGLLLVQSYLFASDAQRRALIDQLVA
jgi:hypothetical protein